MELSDQIFRVLPYAVVIGVIVTGVLVLGRGVWQRFTSIDLEASEPELKVLPAPKETGDPEDPRCICGAYPTHTAPQLVRSRMGWWRSFFAVAPSYRRVVPKDFVPDLCQSCAHLADSMMDRFIFERVRAVQAEANERIAKEAASFERDGLRTMLQETIEEQREPKPKKKSSKKPADVVKLLGS